MTLLIHPGFHKTGTTWLQDELFADSRVFNALMTHDDVDRLIVRPHDFLFDPAVARSQVAARSVSDGRINVISSEILSGNPFYGLREGRVLADRLHAVAPDARIVLTVRAQAPVLRAHYQQYVKRGGMLKPATFFDQHCEPGYCGFDLDLMQYHLFAEYYAGLFGDDRVLVLPQEVLAKNPDGFFDALMHFTGFDAVAAGATISRRRGSGISPPMGGTPLFRFANRLRAAPLQPAGLSGFEWLGNAFFKLGYRATFGSEQQLAKLRTALTPLIADRYARSNRLLQRFVPFALAELGYEIDSD